MLQLGMGGCRVIYYVRVCGMMIAICTDIVSIERGSWSALLARCRSLAKKNVCITEESKVII